MDVAALTAELERRVADRRRGGQYPTGLADDLATHFRRVAAHRRHHDLGEVHAAIAAVEGTTDFGLHRIDAGSRVPGGGVVHRAVGKAVARPNQSALDQVRRLADAVDLALRRIAAALDEPPDHGHVALRHRLDALADGLDPLEAAHREPTWALDRLRHRLARLESLEAVQRVTPWWDPTALQREVGVAVAGSPDDRADLAGRFAGADGVLDLGCGDGAFLRLLAAAGVEATGVEADARLVAAARAHGCEVRHASPVGYLAQLPDASLGGLAAVDLVQHLPAQAAVDLPLLAAAKVRQGGTVIVTSVNPQSLHVYANGLFLQPGSIRPVHPGFLVFLFREAGFAHADVEWRLPPDGADVPVPLATGNPALDATSAANQARLAELVYAPREYAVVATR